MTNETRDRLASLLHAARYGPLVNGVMHGEVVDCDCFEEADRLAANGVTVGLDVERLALALHAEGHVLNMEGSCDNIEGADCLGREFHHEDAEAIAAAYDRLGVER